jgi:hypothetical protein
MFGDEWLRILRFGWCCWELRCFSDMGLVLLDVIRKVKTVRINLNAIVWYDIGYSGWRSTQIRVKRGAYNDFELICPLFLFLGGGVGGQLSLNSRFSNFDMKSLFEE